MWYVYFLQLGNDDIYVGSTNDLERRLESYRGGQVVSTKAYLPVALKSYIAVPTERNARALESYFKSGSGKAFAKKRLWQNSKPRAFADSKFSIRRRFHRDDTACRR
jgi:putative endonuclease